MTKCECENAGYCKRHHVYKNDVWFQLCQTKQNYFDAWEKGNGPGQLIPKDERQGPHIDGVGTELSKMLLWFGIKKNHGCHCKEHIATMNAWGPKECKQQLPLILTWLQDEAKKRKLPFSKMVVRYMVLRAIKLAEKNLA